MENKHTPGPWVYTKNHDYKKNVSGFLILQDRTPAKNIATVIPCIGMTEEEVEANARLIASAPVERYQLIYEDDLPKDIPSEDYTLWYMHSILVDGVRMGYRLEWVKENFG